VAPPAPPAVADHAQAVLEQFSCLVPQILVLFRAMLSAAVGCAMRLFGKILALLCTVVSATAGCAMRLFGKSCQPVRVPLNVVLTVLITMVCLLMPGRVGHAATGAANMSLSMMWDRPDGYYPVASGITGANCQSLLATQSQSCQARLAELREAANTCQGKPQEAALSHRSESRGAVEGCQVEVQKATTKCIDHVGSELHKAAVSCQNRIDGVLEKAKAHCDTKLNGQARDLQNECVSHLTSRA
jgi:hypothetical protein